MSSAQPSTPHNSAHHNATHHNATPQPPNIPNKKIRPPLRRPGYSLPGQSGSGRILGGVCAGLSQHLNIPLSICRIVMVCLAFTSIGLFLYLWMWLFVPSGDPWLAAESSNQPNKIPRLGHQNVDIQTAQASPLPPFVPFNGAQINPINPINPQNIYQPKFTNNIGESRADLTGQETQVPMEIIAVRGILFSLGLLGLAVALFISGPSWLIELDWIVPTILLLCGLFLITLQIPKVESAFVLPTRWSMQQWKVWLLILLGIVMIICAVVLLVGSPSSYKDSLRGALVAFVSLLALTLAFFPLWIRMARQMAETRAAQALATQHADIAAHLHDGVLQTLTLIRARAEDPLQVAMLARAQERELRAWLYTDRPTENTSLAEQFKDMAGQIEDLYAKPIEVVTVGDQVPGDWSDPLLSATREALANACRHGKPPVSLYVEIGKEKSQAFVKDRGSGFALESIDPQRHGVRHSIIERLERHNGSARIKVTPSGCEIEMEVKRI